jgi:hypothetical protein
MSLPIARLEHAGMTSAEIAVLQAERERTATPRIFSPSQEHLMDLFFESIASEDIEEWLAAQRAVYEGRYFCTDPARTPGIAARARELQRGPFSSPSSIFTENVQAMAAVPANESYAPQVGNQFNYANKNWDYLGQGQGPRFKGYTGIGYGGSPVSQRSQILWEYFDIPVFQVPPSTPTQKLWFAVGEEEVLRSFQSNGNMQGTTLAVPVPDPKLLVAGIVKFKGTLTSTGEMVGITGWPANRSLKVNGNASLVKGPGLPLAGVFFGECGATTATLITPALETHAEAEYEAFSIEGAGTDRHSAFWNPGTDTYYEFWNLGMWSGPIVKFQCLGVSSGSLSVLKGVGAEPVGAVLPEIKSNDATKVIIAAGTTITAWNPATGEATLTPPANFALVFGAGATQVSNKTLTLSAGNLGGNVAGQWRYGNGNVFNEVSKSNGIGPGAAVGWGARATNLAAIPANISMRDLVEVAKGGEIEHAIGINLIVTKTPANAPAGRGDESKLSETGGNTGENWQVTIPTFTVKTTASSKVLTTVSSNLYVATGMTMKEVPGNIEAGTKITAVLSSTEFEVDKAPKESKSGVTISLIVPNLGTVDQVPQGSWFRFPNVPAEGLAAYAASLGLVGIVNIVRAVNPLAWAFYEAARKYGIVPLDRTSSTVKGMIYDPKVVGSIYNPGGYNGLAGYTGAAGEPSTAEMAAYVAPVVTATPVGGVMPLKGELQGANCAFNLQPWALLEQVVTRTS